MLAATFAALAGLVAAGSAAGFDQWSVDHLMPWAFHTGRTSTFLESVVPLLHVARSGHAGQVVGQVVTLPGQVGVSLVLVVVAAVELQRRGRLEASVGWIAAWAVGSAVEVVCKQAVTRPLLVHDGYHLTAFDSSWPSGHAMRAGLVACAVATTWPRTRTLVAIWYVALLAALIAAGFHTPTDVLGGVLLAALLGLGVRTFERSGLLRRRAALRAGGSRAAPLRR